MRPHPSSVLVFSAALVVALAGAALSSAFAGGGGEIGPAALICALLTAAAAGFAASARPEIAAPAPALESTPPSGTSTSVHPSPPDEARAAPRAPDVEAPDPAPPWPGNDHSAAIEETAGVGSWSFDARAGALSWSPKTFAIHECEPDVALTLDLAVSFYAHDARPAIEAALEGALRSGAPFDLELPLVTAKGRAIWVRACGRAIRERDGSIHRVIGTFQDVTSRREREDELMAALEKADKADANLSAYQAALDRHAIVAITDAKGDILFVNDRFCEISGYRRDELMGRNHRILNSGAHPKGFFVKMWRAIGSGTSWQGEICNRAKDGDLYWVDTTIVPMIGPDGRPERFVSVRYDITERKKGDAELKEALGQLSSFFEVSPDMLCITDTKGVMLKTSRAVRDVLGLRPEEIVGRTFHEAVHPDDRDETRRAMRALSEEGRPVRIVNRHPAPDGGWRSIEWRATRIRERVYIAARDVTEPLARQVELERAREAAEAAARAKSAFLANMSHEIRTPMNGVMGMLDFLLKSELTDAQTDLARTAKTAATSLLSVLDDVLDVAKIEAGEIAIERLAFDPSELLHDTVRLFGPAASEKGLSLVIHAGALPARVVSDPTRLRQIVTNLVSNAIKFTEAGSVTVTAHFSAPDRLEVAVDDTGIGMDGATLDRLFERFSQADASISRRFGGTGLGLSICRQLARLLGGDVMASSRPGRGSTFAFHVAASVDVSTATADVSGPTGPETAARSLRVLVAEDYPINRKLIALILDGLGHEAVIVEDGAQAVEALDDATFDVILMDMQMPVTDGLTATRRIRARGDAIGRTPIIALTANADGDSADRCLQAGMDAIVTKPIDTTELARTIEAVLLRAPSAPAEPRAA